MEVALQDLTQIVGNLHSVQCCVAWKRTRHFPSGKSSRNAVDTRSYAPPDDHRFQTCGRWRTRTALPSNSQDWLVQRWTMCNTAWRSRVNPPDRSNFAGDYDRVQFNISLEGVIRKAGLNSQGTMFTRSRQFVCFTDVITKHVVTKEARASKSHHQM